MAEVMRNRLPDAVILNEAVEAYRNKNFKSYTREDFDKWFGKYDVSALLVATESLCISSRS